MALETVSGKGDLHIISNSGKLDNMIILYTPTVRGEDSLIKIG